MTLAFVFDSVGAGEWLLLLAVLLVVIGPKNLPGALRKFGSQYAKFHRAADSFRRQLMEMDSEFERAVNSAEREAEEAARIPDVAQTGAPSPDMADAQSADAPPDDMADEVYDMPGENYDMPGDSPDVPSDTPPEMPMRPPAEATAESPEGPVEQPDGDKDTKEP